MDQELKTQYPLTSDPYVDRSSHFWTKLALVPHGPVTISSLTGTGPRIGVCRPLVQC